MSWQRITLLFSHCALRELSYLNSGKTANTSIGRLGTFQENNALPPASVGFVGVQTREDKGATALLAEVSSDPELSLWLRNDANAGMSWITASVWPLHRLVVLDHRHGFPGGG